VLWWWAALAVCAAVLVVALRWAHARRELLRASALLYGGNPEGFLALVEAQRGWQSRAVYGLNRGVARFWQGHFDESLALVEGVGAERMDASTRAAYDGCVLAALVMLGRAREAQQLFAAREPAMRASGHPLRELICDSVAADVALYAHGDLARADELNRALLELPDLPGIALASIHWSLAEIAARRRDVAGAERHLEAALAGAGTTFIAERASALRVRLRGAEQRLADVAAEEPGPPDSLDPMAV
jgi:hypothetical protein